MAIGVQKDDKPQPFRWIEITRRLAGGKFGNLRETQFSGLYDVLEELVGQVGLKVWDIWFIFILS